MHVAERRLRHRGFTECSQAKLESNEIIQKHVSVCVCMSGGTCVLCCVCQVNETQTFLWSSLTVRAFDNLMFICLSVCDDDDDDEVTKL